MAIALTATGWWIYIDQAITPNAGMSRRLGLPHSLLTDIVVVCVVIYNAAFGMSWGPVPWRVEPIDFPADTADDSTGCTLPRSCPCLSEPRESRSLQLP